MSRVAVECAGSRPVSTNGHPTERISEFLSYHLNPLVQLLPSYLKNTTHLLNIFKDIDVLPTNAMLVTLAVSSLYTNIQTNEGIDACRIALIQRTDMSVPTESICDLIRMTLIMNNIVFCFIQRHGTAMGTLMAPAYADLFMGGFEKKALQNYPEKLHLWLRYIDDILMVWTHGGEKLNEFIKYLNSIHPTIKFTSELESYLITRGYKRRFIKEQITRAKQIPRNEALKGNKPATRDTSDRIPFTITYNPVLPNIHDRSHSTRNNPFYNLPNA